MTLWLLQDHLVMKQNRTINDFHTFAIHTLGCKVNTYESQSMINQLTSNGLIQVDFDEVADIYIINTCSVTNTADLKSRSMIARARRNNKEAIIIVAGCYSQVAHQDIAARMKVDIFFELLDQSFIISIVIFN